MNGKSLWILILTGPLWLGFSLGITAEKPYYDGKTLKTLLVKAITYFKENRCVVAETPLLTSRKIYYKALCRFGFLIKRFRIYFDGYAKDEQLFARIKDPDNWFITAADPDLDIWET